MPAQAEQADSADSDSDDGDLLSPAALAHPVERGEMHAYYEQNRVITLLSCSHCLRNYCRDELSRTGWPGMQRGRVGACAGLLTDTSPSYRPLESLCRALG
jgi:hypothetical protein